MLAMIDNAIISLMSIFEYSEGASASIGTVTRNPGQLRQVLPNLKAIGSALKLTAAGETCAGLQEP